MSPQMLQTQGNPSSNGTKRNWSFYLRGAFAFDLIGFGICFSYASGSTIYLLIFGLMYIVALVLSIMCIMAVSSDQSVDLVGKIVVTIYAIITGAWGAYLGLASLAGYFNGGFF